MQPIEKSLPTTQQGFFNVSSANVYALAFWITTFAALTALGARFEIWQYPVPYTLQTMFVLLAGAFLGKRNGAISQILYIAVGAIGLPVFAAGGAIGIARLIGPTGGYLLAFPIAAFVVGYLIENRTCFAGILISMLAGMLVIFTVGTLHLHFLYLRDWGQSIGSGFLIFTWWDGLKLLAAASIYHQFARRVT
jgi:biotin transport system substrate-specific component